MKSTKLGYTFFFICIQEHVDNQIIHIITKDLNSLYTNEYEVEYETIYELYVI